MTRVGSQRHSKKNLVLGKEVFEMNANSDLVVWLLCSSAIHLTSISVSYT